MNKNAIKKFAIEARKKLIDSVTDKAGMLGITEKSCSEPITKGADFEVYQTVAGTEVTLNKRQCEQRRRLVSQIESRGFEAVVEEVAYTWFNRICAIRFMEVNDYLPNRVRVLSSEKEGKMEPDLVTQAPDVDLDLTVQEKEEIINWKMSGTSEDTDKLYCKLFLKQCHQLHDILPGLFEADSDYMELLFGISYTNKDDVIYMLVNPETGIPEADFNVSTLDEEGNPTGQVEIIGWLYQYYNTELKDDTFAKLKKNVKITKERIPAATQLFTPDWIVRYMVENSVGRIWIEHLRAVDPSTDEKATAERFGWKYYLPEAEQEEAVNVKLAEIRTTYKDLKPTDITCIDPCMGSGHILIAMFDVLVDIYESAGYDKREAAFEIVEHNIHGLDIDQRAYQLAYFAVMMKGRGYNRRFLRGRDGKPEPKVYAIVESNEINRNHLQFFGTHLSEMERNLAVMQIEGLLDTFKAAREYGSILNVDACDWNVLERFVDDLGTMGQISFESVGCEETQTSLRKLVRVAKNLGQKYDAVVTNPPYMGASGMGAKLSKYVKYNYSDSKSDLFAVFIEKCGHMAKKNGYQAMITQHAWMFLSSFEKLRVKILETEIVNMVHLGARAFEEIGGEVVQTTSFILRKSHIADYKGKYCRLIDPVSQQGKEEMLFAGENRYIADQTNFSKIPGCPIVYSVGKTFFDAFDKGKLIGNFSTVSEGVKTGNNEKYLRLWFEIDKRDFSFAIKRYSKWVPHHKGGDYRKWYGNREWGIFWDNDGAEIKASSNSGLQGKSMYFKKFASWSKISSKGNPLRYFETNCLFDSGAPAISNELLYTTMALINGKVGQYYISMLNPTLNLQVGDVKSIPLIDADRSGIEKIVENNINISKDEWDSFETSWNFKTHPLIPHTESDGIEIFCGMKIGEKKWIKKLREGSACFSPLGDFIEQGEKTGNNEQGDKFEGVFARLKNDDPRIEEMQEKFGLDLEIIPDGEYMKLRRKSIRKIPVFCLYGFYKEDAEVVSEIANGVGNHQYLLKYEFPDKMYEEFLNSGNPNGEKKEQCEIAFSVGHFQKAIEIELDKKNVRHEVKKIKYDLPEEGEFFIEPTDEYNELIHKAPRYGYQKELRWILPDIRQTGKYILEYNPLGEHSVGMSDEKLIFKIGVTGHVKESVSIESCFERWNKNCNERFKKLKENEEELNRIFIDIYGLQDELTPEVEDKDITVRKADLGREIRSFISYAVGCMFGRYSLDKEGLIYAGGDFNDFYKKVEEPLVDTAGEPILDSNGESIITGEEYGKIKINDEWQDVSFAPDLDNCIPITDEEYFSDDIVARFVDFVKTVYGTDTLEENLDFIANVLGNKGDTSREVIRNYFMKDFYADHLKVYQKRPIYWMFDSGKQNGFKALIYMHRYDADTVGRVRTDYLHRAQKYVETAMQSAQYTIDNASSASEKSKATKAVTKYTKQLAEMKIYDEAIAHIANKRIEIDLDDGVKVNYAKFQGVEVAQEGKKALKVDLLAKIK